MGLRSAICSGARRGFDRDGEKRRLFRQAAVNYRHIYHAGNFADVLKHVILALCLDYLLKKDGALCMIDAHAGAGLYDLSSEEARKTGEWEAGIGRLMSGAGAPADLEAYLRLIEEDLAAGRYPGSPLQAARRLRPQDRLIANELHEPTFEALRGALAPYKNARATQIDAYECVRAHIPPKERRGLVLIDPPFEKKNEFETLIGQMKQWKKRWATGIFLLWYPIKAHLPVAALRDAAAGLALPRTWVAEALIAPRGQADSLNGCGVIVFNAPFTIPERMGALLQHLAREMTLHGVERSWLAPDTD
jgi:23S rRNA (adenine2030-N6)-methyltransferase